MNAIERLREAVNQASAAERTDDLDALAAVDALYRDMKRIENMAYAAGYGETPAHPIAEIARAAVHRVEGSP